MRAADYLIDIGPGAGVHGGQVVGAGTPEEVMANPDILTGQYLSGKKKIPVPAASAGRETGKILKVIGAAENNLRHIDVDIPPGHIHRGHRRVRQRQDPRWSTRCSSSAWRRS